MASMVDRLSDALKSRDARQMAALFAETYESVQPLHPSRGFGGRDQVLSNWSAVFAGVPDFTAELLAWAVNGPVEWGEWDWRGSHTDGSPFSMRGVSILEVQDGLITRAHLYMEPVEVGGGDIDASVLELYKPPAD